MVFAALFDPGGILTHSLTAHNAERVVQVPLGVAPPERGGPVKTRLRLSLEEEGGTYVYLNVS